MGRDDDKPFQSTLLMRGATVLSICRCMVLASFQSTLLMRGATRPLARFSRPTRISIHAPHARSDVSRFSHFCSFTRFQSTLLMRGATVRQVYVAAPRSISIHAPHARSDTSPPDNCPLCQYFNPRSSCEERHSMMAFWKSSSLFQSTLLMRGATGLDFIKVGDIAISIHAPHARSDFCGASLGLVSDIFQSTLLMRGATPFLLSAKRARIFQSTLLMRGATLYTL